MKFGTFFPHQLPRPWGPGREYALFQQALEQVELADQLGIQYCWGQEHHFLEEYAHSSAPEVYLAAFSQRTKRIRLGHGIVLMPPPYNHPVRVAERIATLDLVSGGRVEWGTGESGSRIELEGFGIPYVEKRPMWTEAVREAARMMCMDPYPGYQGRFFSLPARNVVPKPLQAPHPPLWLACSNRETMKHAARCGVGALTFAFMDAKEARFWVEEYYETFKNECTPIGRAVNPNIAMLTQFACHRDAERAVEIGLEGSKFFAFGLSHYYRTGTHRPGQSNIWQDFRAAPPFEHAGNLGIGSPAQIARHFESFEEAGIDQLILLQQAGNMRHEDICASLELFGTEVLPAFVERDRIREEKKRQDLAPYVEAALSRIPPLEQVGDVADIESYPVLAKKQGVDLAHYAQDRSPLPAAMWRLQIAGPRRKKP
jgi:alkanesulfonate monooxygenase SsuD/methylene tetrahydromethanopterin reductase-like flavin-dependent oxidoreductase (luciferase family)